MEMDVKVNHSQVSLGWTLAQLTARRVMRRSSIWVFLLIGLAPCTIVAYWLGTYLIDDWKTNILPYGMFKNILGLYFQLFYMPLLAIFLGLGVVSDEIETKNITFTLVRPLRRLSIVLGRFGGHLLVGWGLITVSILANYFANMLFQVESLFSQLGLLINSILVQCLGFLGYLGVVSMFGTMFKRFSVLLCIFYMFLDVAFSLLPVAKLQWISIQYRTLASYTEIPLQFLPSATEITQVSVIWGLFYCTGLSLICCLIMTWRVRKEIILSDSSK